jgi:hypothetical protein
MIKLNIDSEVAQVNCGNTFDNFELIHKEGNYVKLLWTLCIFRIGSYSRYMDQILNAEFYNFFFSPEHQKWHNYHLWVVELKFLSFENDEAIM